MRFSYARYVEVEPPTHTRYGINGPVSTDCTGVRGCDFNTIWNVLTSMGHQVQDLVYPFAYDHMRIRSIWPIGVSAVYLKMRNRLDCCLGGYPITRRRAVRITKHS